MRWVSPGTSPAGCASWKRGGSSRTPRLRNFSPAHGTSGPGGSCAGSWTPAGSDVGRTTTGPHLGRPRRRIAPQPGISSSRRVNASMSGPRAEIYKKVTLGGPRDVRPADNRTRFSMRGMGGEPQLGSLRGDRFLAHRGLIAVCSVTAMAEAGLLAVFAPAARGLAPQVTALPPLAIFHDLRWLYSLQRSWLWFAFLLAGLLAARSVLNTVLVRLAWPAQLAPPRPLAALRSALAVTAFSCVLISPLVSLTFGVAILPFSWPFLAMLPAMLLIALPLSHAGVADTWWRTLPTAGAAGWLLTEFAVLTAAAAVTAVLPVTSAVPMAGLAGFVNARAWYG